MTDVVGGYLGITSKMKYASGILESPVAKALVYDTRWLEHCMRTGIVKQFISHLSQ